LDTADAVGELLERQPAIDHGVAQQRHAPLALGISDQQRRLVLGRHPTTVAPHDRRSRSGARSARPSAVSRYPVAIVSPSWSGFWRPGRTNTQPAPPTLAAVLGAPSSWSWISVSMQSPGSRSSISQVPRLLHSAASWGSYRELQPCTSRRGGSDSSTASSPHTSPSGPQACRRPFWTSILAPWK